MQSFTDSVGRQWTLSLNVGAVKKVKSLLGIDLLDSEKVFNLQIPDLVDVVYVLIKDQCDKIGISDIQFGESLSGDGINSLIEAFRESYVSFFPKPETREVLKKTLEKMKEAEKTYLEKIDSKLDRLIEFSLSKSLKQFTDSVESSE